MLEVPEDFENHLINTATAAEFCGVSLEAVRQWASRGHLTPSGLDERNRPLYKFSDVLRAERATRTRVRRRITA